MHLELPTLRPLRRDNARRYLATVDDALAKARSRRDLADDEIRALEAEREH